MAKSKTVFNWANINAINRNGVTALKKAADATLTDIIQAQVIPFDYGTMQNDQTFVDYSGAESGQVSIVTSAKQANRLYFHPEYNFQTVNNPNAQAGWFQQWIEGDFTEKAFVHFYAKLNQGVK